MVDRAGAVEHQHSTAHQHPPGPQVLYHAGHRSVPVIGGTARSGVLHGTTRNSDRTGVNTKGRNRLETVFYIIKSCLLALLLHYSL